MGDLLCRRFSACAPFRVILRLSDEDSRRTSTATPATTRCASSKGDALFLPSPGGASQFSPARKGWVNVPNKNSPSAVGATSASRMPLRDAAHLSPIVFAVLVVGVGTSVYPACPEQERREPRPQVPTPVGIADSDSYRNGLRHKAPPPPARHSERSKPILSLLSPLFTPDASRGRKRQPADVRNLSAAFDSCLCSGQSISPSCPLYAAPSPRAFCER